MSLINRSTFITGIGSGLLAASSVSDSALAATGFARARVGPNASGGSVSFSVAIADASDVVGRLTTDNAVLNHDSTYTKWTGNNAENTIKASVTIDRLSSTRINMPFSANVYGKSATGTLVKEIAGLQVQVTALSSVVTYTVDPKALTASGTAQAGSYKLSLSSKGLYTSSGALTGAHVSVGGSLNGSFTTNFASPQAAFVGGRIAPEITNNPLTYFGSLFDSAGLIMLVIPGLEPFGVGCSVIGGAMGLWETFEL